MKLQIAVTVRVLAAMILVALPARSAGDVRIDQALSRTLDRIVELRHTIHQNPEMGNREFKTAELVAEHLRSLDFEVRTGVAHTGVVGLLRGGRPGPVIAVRADMDALPVTENTPFPFRSEVRTEYLGKPVGVMHACGHDVHTAVQLGVASVLSALRDELPGTVKFIFQPAEEGPPPGEEGGAKMMLKEGVLTDPRPVAIFGLHTLAQLEVGKVGYTYGAAFAAVDHFRVTLVGKQAHGAAPHLSVDPVIMAAQAITALQTIRSRNLDPLAPSVVTVGIIRGGERFNIIPAEVELEGTVRTYSPEVRDTVERRMGEILDGMSKVAGGSYRLDYERGTPPTVNARVVADRALPVMRDLLGADNVIELPPTMGGEDFAYFAGEVPGFYFRLGMVKPGTESGGHHTPTFQADDSSLEVGVRVMSHVLTRYLEDAAGVMNRRLTTFGDLKVGQRTAVTKTITDADIRTFVDLCGDANPLHVDAAFAERTFFRGRIAHGLLTASLLSTAIGMKLPGAGAIYRSQTLQFLKAVRPGDTLTAHLEIESLDPAENEIALVCRIDRHDGATVLRGKAVVSLIRKFDT